MNKISKLSFVAVIYTALFNIPIFYLKSEIGSWLCPIDCVNSHKL